MERDFQRERLSDVAEVFRDRAAWERQKQEALAEYKREHAKGKATLDESSPEFAEDRREKNRFKADLEAARREFVTERDERRREERATISLSEEKELGIDKQNPRVDWKKRGFFATTGKGVSSGGSSPGRFSGSPGGSVGEPPPADFVGNIPPPPPPDFYESEPPPPPPPPPFDPPPMGGPGGFDDSLPPPVFEDGGVPEF